MNYLKKLWKFLWHDDTSLSWVVSVLLAFIIVKFLIYPGVGLLFGTSYPIVAVVSSSMEHEGQSFDDWWESNSEWYVERDMTKKEFSNFKFKNGFNKGDIMIVLEKNQKI